MSGAPASLSLIRSRDGGLTWSDATPVLPVPDLQSWGMAFDDAGHGWLMSDGNLFRTRDDGATWAETPAPVDEERLAERISARDERIAPISGPDTRGVPPYREFAFLTTDGGLTWSDVEIPPGAGRLQDVLIVR